METDIVTIVSDLVNTVGMWAVFAWLYVSEKKSHEKTRTQWVEDLRDIAGMRPHLGTTPPPPPTAALP